MEELFDAIGEIAMLLIQIVGLLIQCAIMFYAIGFVCTLIASGPIGIFVAMGLLTAVDEIGKKR